MEIKIMNAEKLLPDIKEKFLPYLKDMVSLHKNNLLSVFLYGDATGKNYIPKKSPLTSAFIFKSLPFSVLKESLRIIDKGIKKKITAPLFLTKNHIETSLDVFPIEFLDMKDNHVVLYGEDILSSLVINDRHIRLFCEEQIKGKLIRIRQAYLEIGLKNQGVEALLKESLTSLLPIFRNVLRLKKQNPPIDNENILNQLCVHFDLDETVFLPILKDNTNDEKIGNQEVTFYLEKYLEQLNKLATEVDQI